MGVLEAFARLGVPPVPPAKTAGGTGKPLAAVGCSPCSPSSTIKVREPDAALLSPEERRAWGDELNRDLHGWLSVHPRDVWSDARIGDRITPRLERLEVLLSDYELTGEPGDRKAAVFAANAVAAVAARAAREWVDQVEAGEQYGRGQEKLVAKWPQVSEGEASELEEL